jgi:hypothetical protein
MAYSPDTATQVSPLITISGRNAYRPKLTGNPIMSSNRSYNAMIGGIQYLNASAYSTPQPYAPYGNSPRNAVRGFAFWQLDTGLTKDFAVTGRAHVQFRAEAFNITNETNFGDPNTNYSGTCSSSTPCNSFGLVNSALPARELQVAGKIIF